ncbi:MAG: flagellar assembly protein FliW [Deltaproteobacteria bacterium]|jgi:flagellar assembly factor FliW|nr:flagellar assembly protein FliW [Deltaproteobacteria bacterium]
MRIDTKRFGGLDVSPDSVITVLGGIIGFPDLTRYVLIQRANDKPFYWLQCLDDPTLALVLIDPVLFKEDYAPALPQGIAQELGEGDLSLFAIVTIPPGKPQEMTANLLGPLALNPLTRKARQLVLDDRFHDHRHPIIQP